ncbi:MAG: DNA adenine methylase, partial [Bacteroidota bacterium]|nr:DNA adenine methylase [Bacteroidota bacterium]
MFNESTIIKSNISELFFPRSRKLFPEFEIQKPFLKWAGGKTQMISDILKFTPKNFNKYIEPFIGGGAVYFNLNHPKSIIADSNEELIITYRQVRDDIEGVIRILEKY